MNWLLRYWDTISIAVCFVMYAGTAYIRYRKEDMPMALTFAAYALANIGFIWQFRK